MFGEALVVCFVGAVARPFVVSKECNGNRRASSFLLVNEDDLSLIVQHVLFFLCGGMQERKKMLTVVAILISLFLVFNPYMAWIWRTDDELWRTREESYGWPFYWKMQPGNDPEAKRKYYSCLTNPTCKVQRRVKNVIYVE